VQEIILVEDSDNDAALVRRALRSLSVANPIRHLETGTDALAYLNTVLETAAVAPPSVSIIFIDLILPGMSGFEVLRHIAGQPAFAKTLRIVLTNLTDTDTIKRAYSLGAHSFLIKPIQSADLQELMTSFPSHWSFDLHTSNPVWQKDRGAGVPVT
jgi:two-component system, response regulator